MKPPRCKLCLANHWLREPHVFPVEHVTKPLVTKPAILKKVGRPLVGLCSLLFDAVAEG